MHVQFARPKAEREAGAKAKAKATSRAASGRHRDFFDAMKLSGTANDKRRTSQSQSDRGFIAGELGRDLGAEQNASQALLLSRTSDARYSDACPLVRDTVSSDGAR
jgi:hypothetical protein